MLKVIFKPFVSVYQFYYQGFKGMKLGKTLWAIILIKLFIMFIVLKMIFFPNYLNERYDTKQEKADHVLEEMTNRR